MAAGVQFNPHNPPLVNLLAVVQGRDAEQRTMIAGLNGDLNDTRRQLALLQARLAEQQGEVQRLQKELHAAQEQAPLLLKQSADYERRLNQLIGDLDRSNQRVRDLTAEIDRLAQMGALHRDQNAELQMQLRVEREARVRDIAAAAARERLIAEFQADRRRRMEDAMRSLEELKEQYARTWAANLGGPYAVSTTIGTALGGPFGFIAGSYVGTGLGALFITGSGPLQEIETEAEKLRILIIGLARERGMAPPHEGIFKLSSVYSR